MANGELTTSAQTTGQQNPYMVFYGGPLTYQTGIPGLEFDFNHGARIKVPEGNWRVKIIDQDTYSTLYDVAVSDSLVTSNKKYYVRFRLEIYRDDKLVFCHDFQPRGRKILLQYPVRSILGDNIAAFPYAQAFKHWHDCEVYCAIEPQLAALFQTAYPEIHYIGPDERPDDIYATYYSGFFYPCSDRIYHPADWRILGLQRSTALLLGLKAEEIRPVIIPPRRGRRIREPYVCIAAQASSQAKYWNHAQGWLETVAYLKAKGYRVLCIDKEQSHGGNLIPYGAEDFTGSDPLLERAELLYYADFFIGLGSGLSWLAWAVGKPVILISGFSLPVAEFATPYRIINYHVCNGCFNDSRVQFDNEDFFWCPRHQGTPRQFECTRLIASGQVMAAIDRLMQDYGLEPQEALRK